MNINSIEDLNKIKDQIKEGIKETIKDVNTDTMNRVPVRTGKLRHSYKVTFNGKAIAGGLNSKNFVEDFELNNGNNLVDFSYNTDYAEFVEYGTVHITPRLYLTKAVANIEEKLKDNINKNINNS